ncbi:MAG: hypothetical protein ACOCRO_08920, partial [Halanaerobiales bacterium]
MSNSNELDKLIKSSLESNLNQINFDKEMHNNVLQETVQKRKKFLYIMKAVLNYEFEIPVAYVAVFGVVLITLFSSQLTAYFPGPEEIADYQLEWVFIDKGVI